MVATAYGKVINCVRASTKWGPRLALNIKLSDNSKVACWSEVLDNKSFLSLKSGDSVRLIQGAKGKYTLLEDEVSMNRLSSNGSKGSYYTNPHPNGNDLNTVSNEIEDILDLPSLSDVDKRNMMEYIRSQSKLLKFCYETVCKDFPTLEEFDSRGARSWEQREKVGFSVGDRPSHLKAIDWLRVSN